MKKEVFLLFIIFILFTSFTSANYECSDNAQLIRDQDEIYLYDRTSINGIGIGLILSDETALNGKYYATLIVDAVKFLLSDSENSTEVELKTKTSTINFLNITSEGAKIKVDDDTEFLEEGYTKTINNLKVFLSGVEEVYPGSTVVEGIIGKEIVSLDNTDSYEIVSIDDADYLIKLFSASDTNAVINVGKCENENASIIEVADVIEPENETESNETVEQTKPVVAISLFDEDVLEKKSRVPIFILFGMIGVLVLVIALLSYLRIKSL